METRDTAHNTIVADDGKRPVLISAEPQNSTFYMNISSATKSLKTSHVITWRKHGDEW